MWWNYSVARSRSGLVVLVAVLLLCAAWACFVGWVFVIR
jgi:hypothetical protein